jgi:hypothetical protein
MSTSTASGGRQSDTDLAQSFGRQGRAGRGVTEGEGESAGPGEARPDGARAPVQLDDSLGDRQAPTGGLDLVARGKGPHGPNPGLEIVGRHVQEALEVAVGGVEPGQRVPQLHVEDMLESWQDALEGDTNRDEAGGPALEGPGLTRSPCGWCYRIGAFPWASATR